MDPLLFFPICVFPSNHEFVGYITIKTHDQTRKKNKKTRHLHQWKKPQRQSWCPQGQSNKALIIPS